MFSSCKGQACENENVLSSFSLKGSREGFRSESSDCLQTATVVCLVES